MRCFTGEQLRSYCTQVLTRAGISPTDAATVADCLVDADLSGVESHGVSRLSIYLQRLDAGAVSYTHLDVYKRQVPRRPSKACSGRPRL